MIIITKHKQRIHRRETEIYVHSFTRCRLHECGERSGQAAAAAATAQRRMGFTRTRTHEQTNGQTGGRTHTNTHTLLRCAAVFALSVLPACQNCLRACLAGCIALAHSDWLAGWLTLLSIAVVVVVVAVAACPTTDWLADCASAAAAARWPSPLPIFPLRSLPPLPLLLLLLHALPSMSLARRRSASYNTADAASSSPSARRTRSQPTPPPPPPRRPILWRETSANSALCACPPGASSLGKPHIASPLRAQAPVCLPARPGDPFRGRSLVALRSHPYSPIVKPI